MGRIEFPSTPIGAKKTASQPETNSGTSPFHQATFAELDCPSRPEIELGNCLITSAVTFRKLVRGNEWHCHIRAEPDLMYPDQEGEYEAYAQNEDADQAHQYHLRPGDRAMMKGTNEQQRILLENGETMIMNRFYVTQIEIITRSPRKSITVFEQQGKIAHLNKKLS